MSGDEHFEENAFGIHRFWKLIDQVNVVEATLLVLGIEPQGLSDDIEKRVDRAKPDGYIPVRKAIMRELESRTIEGQLQGWFSQEPTEVQRASEADPKISFVYVESLRLWLKNKGVTDGYFFQEARPRGFRDPAHPRYAPKLAAAVEAWENFDGDSNEPGRPKQRMMVWLRLNAARFGLTGEDGRPSENVIEEIAKVSNWATGGGAPKSAKPNLDEEIQF